MRHGIAGMLTVAAAVAWAVRIELAGRLQQPFLGIAVLLPYGVIYLAVTGPSQIRQRLRGD